MNKLPLFSTSLLALTASANAFAHTGHGDMSHTSYALILLAGITSAAIGFYCLSKVRRLRRADQSQQETV